MNSVFKEQVCCVCKSINRNIYLKNIKHTREYDVMGALGISENEEPLSNVYKCFSCGHYYLSPIVSTEAMNKYYSKLSSKFYDLNKPTFNGLEKEHERIVKMVNKIKPEGKLLELGSGYGFLINRFKKSGYHVFGIEPSPVASKFAIENLNLNIINGFLNEDTFAEDSFDIIISFDVFEHLASTNELMVIFKKILKRNGLLVIGTGNISSFYPKLMRKKWWYLSSWEHISFFTPRSISFMGNIHQFEMISVDKVSHNGSFIRNTINLGKVFFKLFINIFRKRKFEYNLCFDHLILYAINRK